MPLETSRAESPVFKNSGLMANPKKGIYTMKNLSKYAFVVLGLALCACASAHGLAFGSGSGAKPEIDPSLAISGLTLLAGTLAVLRVRRSK